MRFFCNRAILGYGGSYGLIQSVMIDSVVVSCRLVAFDDLEFYNEYFSQRRLQIYSPIGIAEVAAGDGALHT